MTNQIIEILKEIIEDADGVSWETVNFIEEELLDSIKMVELVDHLESVFAVKISPMDLETKNFESILAIEQLIKKNKAM